VLIASLIAALLADAGDSSQSRVHEIKGRLGLKDEAKPTGAAGRAWYLAQQTGDTRSAAVALKMLEMASRPVFSPGQVAQIDHLRHLVVLVFNQLRGQSPEAKSDPFVTRRKILQDLAHNKESLLDWIELAQPDYMSMTLSEAVDASTEWHRTSFRTLGYRQPVPPALTVLRWPDGARIDRLVSNRDFVAEGASMGHCVGGLIGPNGIPSGNSRYYQNNRDGRSAVLSYRNSDGVPQATVQYLTHSHDPHGIATLTQLQGPQDGPITNELALDRLQAWAWAGWNTIKEPSRLLSHVGTAVFKPRNPGKFRGRVSALMPAGHQWSKIENQWSRQGISPARDIPRLDQAITAHRDWTNQGRHRKGQANVNSAALFALQTAGTQLRRTVDLWTWSRGRHRASYLLEAHQQPGYYLSTKTPLGRSWQLWPASDPADAYIIEYSIEIDPIGPPATHGIWRIYRPAFMDSGHSKGVPEGPAISEGPDILQLLLDTGIVVHFEDAVSQLDQRWQAMIDEAEWYPDHPGLQSIADKEPSTTEGAHESAHVDYLRSEDSVAPLSWLLEHL